MQSQNLHSNRIIVVGAGQAGLSLCATLRSEGHSGPVALIGAESFPPYQRPPLSKAFMAGKLDRERLFLKPDAFFRELDISLLTGATVTSIDRKKFRLFLDSGRELEYDLLAIATGARPRRLPERIGGGLKGVHVLRDIHDSERIAGGLAGGKRLLVVGGGYIGLEIAACSRMKGVEVLVVEIAPRLLARVAGAEIAECMAGIHRSHGVELRFATRLESIHSDSRGKLTAQFGDAKQLDADLVVAGIGAEPEVGLASSAGLDIENGIRVDSFCQTSDPAIFAAGDCTSFPFRSRRVRLESVQNAVDQAETAARNMLGQEIPYQPVPWFWSDQYDAHLQIAGLSREADQVVMRQGVQPGACSAWYYARGELIAADAINDSRAYMVAKRLLGTGKSADPEQVADPATNLKRLL